MLWFSFCLAFFICPHFLLQTFTQSHNISMFTLWRSQIYFFNASTDDAACEDTINLLLTNYYLLFSLPLVESDFLSTMVLCLWRLLEITEQMNEWWNQWQSLILWCSMNDTDCTSKCFSEDSGSCLEKHSRLDILAADASFSYISRGRNNLICFR